MERFNKKIQRQLKFYLDKGELVPSEILKLMIENQFSERMRILQLKDRFNQNNLPIDNRGTLDIYSKHNYKLKHDFVGQIVRNAIGYVMGKPIKYTSNQNSKHYKILDEIIWEVNKNNNVVALDLELSKLAMMCGYVGKLLYVNKKAEVKFKIVQPEELFIIGDDLDTSDYIVRYFRDFDENFNEIWMINIYDDKKMYTYREYKTDTNLEYLFVEERLHLFNKLPLILVQNNYELRGDVERVISLIDAYDAISSDYTNDLSEMRSAYMAIFGEINVKQLKDAMSSGILVIPPNSLGQYGDVKFVTKSIDVQGYMSRLEKLRDDIMEFSENVNFDDDKFNESSGIAMKYKLMMMEMKTSIFANFYKTSLSRTFEVLIDFYKFNKNITDELDYREIEFIFSRNIPDNFKEEIENFVQLYGKVSDQTAFSQLSFVSDVVEELNRIKGNDEADDKKEE